MILPHDMFAQMLVQMPVANSFSLPLLASERCRTTQVPGAGASGPSAEWLWARLAHRTLPR
eukprot:5600450-Alexandrium_andersonii.AAC.1